MTEPLILRPYQLADIARLRDAFRQGARNVVYQLPTGAGKTVCFASILLSATTLGRRSAVICHRRELIRQASNKLTWAGVPHGIVAAGMDRDHDAAVLVASIDTIRQRQDVPSFNFIVVDEVHHCRAATWHTFLENQPQAKILGVSASPARTDGRGLGIEDGGLFDALVCGPPIAQLQADGYLAKTRCFVPPQQIDTRGVKVQHGDYQAEELAKRASVITGDAVREYTRRCCIRDVANPANPSTPAIAFCCTIKHAENVAEAFRAAGYRSAAVHGGIETSERDRLIASLGDGRLDVLTACEIISEGVDVPVVGAVILLRPTKSLVMFLQQVGRGMRPKPDGGVLTVLDHSGNTLTHGLPEDDRAWSLAGVPRREKDENEETKERRIGWLCRRCDCLNPPGTPECLDCGAPNPNARKIAHVDGELTEAMPAAQKARQLERIAQLSYRELKNRPRSLDELRAYGKARGYKRGWAHHFFREQQERHTGGPR